MGSDLEAWPIFAAVGVDRARPRAAAEKRGAATYTLVGVGSALFMLISKYGFYDVLVPEEVILEPSRVAAQIVSGIGSPPTWVIDGVHAVSAGDVNEIFGA
jgi:putative Mg2+ transporter-C (MgtC) family protein